MIMIIIMNTGQHAITITTDVCPMQQRASQETSSDELANYPTTHWPANRLSYSVHGRVVHERAHAYAYMQQRA